MENEKPWVLVANGDENEMKEIEFRVLARVLYIVFWVFAGKSKI